MAYAPESPDLTGYYTTDTPPQHQQYRGSISHAQPFSHVQPQQQQQQQQQQSYYEPPPQNHQYQQSPTTYHPPDIQPAPTSNMAKRVWKHDDGDEEWTPDTPAPGGAFDDAGGSRMHGVKMEGNGGGPSSVANGIEVRTKFPVARIKRIMQADDDVGKVAQVTPVAVSKALELFMISLVTKAAAEAKSRSSKRVLAVHLKQAIMRDEQFDFLMEKVSKVPDAPSGGAEKTEEGLAGGEDVAEGKRRKGAGRRKRKDSGDDF